MDTKLDTKEVSAFFLEPVRRQRSNQLSYVPTVNHSGESREKDPTRPLPSIQLFECTRTQNQLPIVEEAEESRGVIENRWYTQRETATWVSTIFKGVLSMPEGEVTITVRPNGPFRVEGPIKLVDANGQQWDLSGKPAVSLCRCGASTNKPFCDGQHSKMGFQAAEAAVAAEAQAQSGS